MKNLKKVLALVLVVATLMGFATVAGAQFTDDSSVTYKEAVEVMAAIDVINGYTDGTFRPTANVTRAQMAKMVTFILNKGNDVGDLYKSANTFGDCTTHWARGYIAYASKTGIVAGVGNGKFNPEGSVTGTQAAKMLLCALGYDATVETYTGANWAVNVLNDADAAGLLKKLGGVDMSAALTREQAAQMMFNALRADMVKYSNKGSNIVINGIEIAQGASDAEAVTCTKGEGTDGQIKKDGIVQFAEKYFTDLKKTSAATDDFGRPASTWKNKTTTIGTYADPADESYTEEVDYKTIYADLGLSEATKANLIDENKGVDKEITLSKKDTTKVENSGNGVQTEVYMDENDNISIVLVHTYADTVKSTTPAKNGDKAYVTLEGGRRYETESFAKDDVVLYTYADGEVQSMTKAEVVSGVEVTRRSSDSFTAGGTTYKYSKDIAESNKADIKLNSVLDLYLDEFGYVAMVKVNKDSTDSAYVVKAGESSSIFDSDVYAKLLMTDGTIVEAKVTKVGSSDATKTLVKDLEGKIVEFSKNKDDEYTLKAYSSGMTNGDSAKITVKKGESAMALGSDSTNFYANTKTIFLVQTGTESKPVYNAYTGYANVPSLKAASGSYAVYCENGNVANVVFVKGATATSSNKDIVMVLGSKGATEVNDADLGKYYEYPAVINGETATIKLKSEISADTLYSAIVKDEDDIVDPTASTVYGNKAADADNYSVSGQITAAADNGTIGISGTYYAVSDDVQTWKITTDGAKSDKVESDAIGNIEKDLNATAVVKNGEVVSIFYKVAKEGGSSEEVVDTSIKSVVLNSDKTITLTLNGKADAKTTYTADLQMWNAETAEYKSIQTVDLTVDKGSASASSNALGSIAAGKMYKVVVGGVESDPVSF